MRGGGSGSRILVLAGHEQHAGLELEQILSRQLLSKVAGNQSPTTVQQFPVSVVSSQ